MGDLVDDVTIANDAALWRRVPPWHIVPDENRGGHRVSSAAFEDDQDGSPMSVVLGDDVLASDRTAESVLADYSGFALARICAGLARELKQGICRDPTVDEPAHALVFGKKSKGVSRAMSRASVWIIPPIDIE